MKTAVIDIGSNSVRLMLLADGNVLYKTLESTRLGEGMYGSGLLTEIASTRTAEAVANFYVQAKQEGASEVYAFATAAVRSAKNKEIFLEKVKSLCGLDVQVLSGEREAKIGILGALGDEDGGIIDVGGASTEIILQKNGKTVYSKSLNVGVVRLKDACGRDMQFLKKECEKFADEYGELPSGLPFYAIGGSATTLAALYLNLQEYDSKKVTGTVITKDDMDRLVSDIAKCSVERLALHPCVSKKRADVLLGGAVMLATLMERNNIKQLIISDSDNLEGFAKTMGLL